MSSLDGRRDTATPWQQANATIFSARTANEHAQHLVPHIQPNAQILDVGCGMGSISIGLARVASQGRLVGIDTDAKAILAASERAGKEGVSNIEFSVGDVYDLSRFPAEHFDIVHAHQVAGHLTEPVKALTEMRRVLKKGGVISLRDGASEFIVIPPDPVLEKQFGWYTDFKERSGTSNNGGRLHHIWMHAAGFPWERIETSSVAVEWSGPKRKMFADGARNTFRSLGVRMGYGSEAEFDEIEQHWISWSQKEEGRCLSLDSAVLGWK